MLPYTDSWAGPQPDFVNVIASSSQCFALSKHVSDYRQEVQIFKRTQHTYQQQRAKKAADYPCAPALPSSQHTFPFCTALPLAQLRRSARLRGPRFGASSKSHPLGATAGRCGATVGAGVPLNTGG